MTISMEENGVVDDNDGLCVYGLFGSGAGGRILAAASNQRTVVWIANALDSLALNRCRTTLIQEK